MYGLFPGLTIALQRDTAEPLAYAFITIAMYILYFGGKYKIVLSALFFALGGLTKEITLIFPLAYIVTVFLRNHTFLTVKQTLMLVFISVLPLIVYKLLLLLWLESTGLRRGEVLEFIPFKGIFVYWPWNEYQIRQVTGVIIPTITTGITAVIALFNKKMSIHLFVLLANILVLVIFVGRASYDDYNASVRVITGVIVATLYCLPVLDRVTNYNRAWFWFSIIFYFYIWKVMDPLWKTHDVNLLLFISPIILFFLHVLRQTKQQRIGSFP